MNMAELIIINEVILTEKNNAPQFEKIVMITLEVLLNLY